MKIRSTTKNQFKKLHSIYRGSIRKGDKLLVDHCERMFFNDFGMNFKTGDYAFNQCSIYGTKWLWLFNKEGYKGWKFNRIMDLPGVNF